MSMLSEIYDAVIYLRSQGKRPTDIWIGKEHLKQLLSEFQLVKDNTGPSTIMGLVVHETEGSGYSIAVENPEWTKAKWAEYFAIEDPVLSKQQ